MHDSVHKPSEDRQVLIVPAAPAESGGTAELLARAFAEDEYTLRLLPARDRARRITRLFEQVIAETFETGGHVYLAIPANQKSPVGAALWEAPSARPTARKLLGSITAYPRIFGGRLPDAIRTAAAIHHHRPRVPHWYLHAVGTLPEARGQGAGVELIRAGLAKADSDGVGAYLESSHRDKVALYERHGFQERYEVKTSGTTPLIGMWRPPRIAGHEGLRGE